MLLGYNTNGFAHHRLEDAVEIIADLGYGSVALTLDVHHLDPFDNGWPAVADSLRARCQKRGLRITIETGARFLLDSRRKHQPTLISPDPDHREQRIEFLQRAIEIAGRLGADSVSLWSGSIESDRLESRSHSRTETGSHLATGEAPVENRCHTFDRLCTSLRAVLDHAERYEMPLAFEPEPGMAVETMAQFARLHEVINHPLFGLTLDIGHVHCLGDGELTDHVRRHAGILLNVHLEDMRRGVHDHLMFGDGEIDFARVAGAFRAVNYAGPLHVELSRHSHNAVETARRAHKFLTTLGF